MINLQLREIVFEFIRECRRQEMDYEEGLFSRLSMVDPSITSWVKLPAKNLSMMESIPLVAEEMISRLLASNWVGLDDRQEIIKTVINQTKSVSSPCTEMLIQESRNLDSTDFLKIKQRKLQNLGEFVQRVRGMMQQW